MIHPVLASLDWSKLSPSHQDLELMVRVMGQFLPACHAFLGSVFVQIRWAELVTAEVSTAQPANLHPALLCLLVKLGGEPSVRQSGRLVAVLQQAEAWDWGRVDSAKYEALAQWLVMSIDCRAIVKHPERSTLDEATLKLFKAAAISGPESVKKQKIWIKCCTRLLSSCGSKHKNFLSYNQPALHTAVRRLLEDMTALGSQDPASSPAVVKDFLTLLNSNSSSCLPGAAVMVLQSWLGGLHRASPPLHALLAQAAVCINEVRVAAAVLEAVLESWFRDTEDDNSDNSWGAVLGLLAWPAGTRMTQVLEQSVQAGHILLLHAYLSYRRPQAASIKEEQMLASSVLEWLRSLSLAPGLGAGAEAKTSSASHLWVSTKNEFSSQERRFFKDFRPFFLLCQLSGMFPNKLNWKLSFSWGYWATYFCLANVCVMIILLIFYVSQVRRQLHVSRCLYAIPILKSVYFSMFIVQVVMVVAERAGFLYIAYNLSWVVHVFHSIDFILLFYLDKKDFVQIFQGYRKFYRYGTDERIHIMLTGK